MKIPDKTDTVAHTGRSLKYLTIADIKYRQPLYCIWTLCNMDYRWTLATFHLYMCR